LTYPYAERRGRPRKDSMASPRPRGRPRKNPLPQENPNIGSLVMTSVDTSRCICGRNLNYPLEITDEAVICRCGRRHPRS